MSTVVLDASAVLTVLNQERGADRLTPELLRDAVISAVNLAEVQSKLVARGVDPHAAWEATLSIVAQCRSNSNTPELPATSLHAHARSVWPWGTALAWPSARSARASS
jgi:ribonuclease VapC